MHDEFLDFVVLSSSVVGRVDLDWEGQWECYPSPLYGLAPLLFGLWEFYDTIYGAGGSKTIELLIVLSFGFSAFASHHMAWVELAFQKVILSPYIFS